DPESPRSRSGRRRGRQLDGQYAAPAPAVRCSVCRQREGVRINAQVADLDAEHATTVDIHRGGFLVSPAALATGCMAVRVVNEELQDRPAIAGNVDDCGVAGLEGDLEIDRQPAVNRRDGGQRPA